MLSLRDGNLYPVRPCHCLKISGTTAYESTSILHKNVWSFYVHYTFCSILSTVSVGGLHHSSITFLSTFPLVPHIVILLFIFYYRVKFLGLSNIVQYFCVLWASTFWSDINIHSLVASSIFSNTNVSLISNPFCPCNLTHG